LATPAAARYYKRAEQIAKAKTCTPQTGSITQGGYLMSKHLLVAFALLVGCATEPKSPQNIPLKWMPEKYPLASAGAAPPEFFTTKVMVPPMSDKVANPHLIGVNKEKAQPREVTTGDDVAVFVTQQFKRQLIGTHMNVVDDGASSIIKGDIRQFFVTETDEYAGEITIDITVTDAAGKSLWQGVTSGSSTRTGRSYQPANYYQSLSDALTLATTSLLQMPDFQRAILHK
jgi:hypothetical protein